MSYPSPPSLSTSLEIIDGIFCFMKSLIKFGAIFSVDALSSGFLFFSFSKTGKK